MTDAFKYLSPLVLLFLILSCRDKDPVEELNAQLDTEITQRFSLINSVKGNSEIQKSASRLHQKTKELELMSKDIENLPSTLNHANNWIKSINDTLHITHELLSLERGMNLDEISAVLKQNELLLLNEIVLKNKLGEVQLSSAR
jgi:hypothetical protein